MFLASAPDADRLRRFLALAAAQSFSYEPCGLTRLLPDRAPVPAGFDLDHHRVLLGRGPAVLAAARRALARWAMFDLGWVRMHAPGSAIEVGTTVAVLARVGPLWSLNACRVVWIEETAERLAFAYGTLSEHVERGEERFMVEIEPGGGEAAGVHYDLLAVSRPGHPLARLGRPLVRRLQRRFARDSLAAMVRAMSTESATAVGNASESERRR